MSPISDEEMVRTSAACKTGPHCKSLLDARMADSHAVCSHWNRLKHQSGHRCWRAWL